VIIEIMMLNRGRAAYHSSAFSLRS